MSEQDTHTFPVLPLRDSVLFPGVATPIGAGRPGTLKAVQAAVADPDRLVFVVAQRENRTEVTPELLYSTGTVAHIDQIQKTSGNAVQLLLDGKFRGVGVRFQEKEGRLDAVVRPVEEILPTDTEDPAFLGLQRELRSRATDLGREIGIPDEVVKGFLQNVEEPSTLTDLVATYLDLPTHEKQMLLETFAVEERLRMILLHVERQINVVEAQQDIKDQVQRELGDRQREMVLREQLKAIQAELADGEGGDEIEELRERLEALDLPEEARKEVDRELGRLGRSNRESMEHQVIRTYLETVEELPWNERSRDHLDLEAAERILDEDHYGLQDVKDRVLEFLAVRQLRERRKEDSAGAGESEGEMVVDEAVDRIAAEIAEETGDADEPSETPSSDESTPTPAGNEDDRAKGSILLFVGPPGVGKTSVAKSIARAMDREYVRISLGGVRDEADIRGHRRTYVGAMPGRILKGMKQAGTKNPVFLLDEVDKVGASFQGDPAAALLEVLDPAQNDTFVDHYLGVPFDLSEVMFIATANFLQSIPSPLLDRMERVDFSGYTEREKREIARRYLLPRQERENALRPKELDLTDDGLGEVISRHTREAGVRQLERALGKLCRKVARKIASGETERLTVDPEAVEELLGRPKIRPESAAREDQVGVATGMYYTPAGGDIMFVEAATMSGKGKLTLTGQLGDVMKESATAAWTYARSHADSLGIDPEQFELDVHIHVPAGAVPKDGPSAGITMATALISSLSERPIDHDLAMTGELTLTGRVLPIGGVKEKVLGASRAGIHRVVLPKENEAALDDLPDDVRESLEISLVEELSEVLELALRPGEVSSSRPSIPRGSDEIGGELPH